MRRMMPVRIRKTRLPVQWLIWYPPCINELQRVISQTPEYLRNKKDVEVISILETYQGVSTLKMKELLPTWLKSKKKNNGLMIVLKWSNVSLERKWTRLLIPDAASLWYCNLSRVNDLNAAILHSSAANQQDYVK